TIITTALCIALLWVLGPGAMNAQITGELPLPSDSTIIFTPARPLMEEIASNAEADRAAGLDLLFSGSGWGVGGFYIHKISETFALFGHAAISPRRNADEVESVWYNGYIPIVANKLNRLFMFPVTAGLQYRLFSATLQETFRPFVSAGVTGTPILQTPYLLQGRYYEFFESFGYGTWHFRMGAMFGIGAAFGSLGKGSLIGVNIRYYTIPFGEPGLESLAALPISNFGGVFLSLSVGTAW
ncbi:MAG: hypothetical protein H7X70_03135, partial [Candidatus Kapabacteria bacterium]|nr:hypothetical protein [Candidatus Kapabacteria bacterium]